MDTRGRLATIDATGAPMPARRAGTLKTSEKSRKSRTAPAKPRKRRPKPASKPRPPTPPARADPKALTVGQAAGLLKIAREVIAQDIAAGAPTGAGGTLDIVHYAAWLNRELGARS